MGVCRCRGAGFLLRNFRTPPTGTRWLGGGPEERTRPGTSWGLTLPPCLQTERCARRKLMRPHGPFSSPWTVFASESEELGSDATSSALQTGGLHQILPLSDSTGWEAGMGGWDGRLGREECMRLRGEGLSKRASRWPRTGLPLFHFSNKKDWHCVWRDRHALRHPSGAVGVASLSRARIRIAVLVTRGRKPRP